MKCDDCKNNEICRYFGADDVEDCIYFDDGLEEVQKNVEMVKALRAAALNDIEIKALRAAAQSYKIHYEDGIREEVSEVISEIRARLHDRAVHGYGPVSGYVLTREIEAILNEYRQKYSRKKVEKWTK